MFDLKSDGICRKITESQHGMFLHNNTSRLNDFFFFHGRREEGGTGLCSVTHESHFPVADFTVENADCFVLCGAHGLS